MQNLDLTAVVYQISLSLMFLSSLPWRNSFLTTMFAIHRLSYCSRVVFSFCFIEHHFLNRPYCTALRCTALSSPALHCAQCRAGKKKKAGARAVIIRPIPPQCLAQPQINMSSQNVLAGQSCMWAEKRIIRLRKLIPSEFVFLLSPLSFHPERRNPTDLQAFGSSISVKESRDRFICVLIIQWNPCVRIIDGRIFAVKILSMRII